MSLTTVTKFINGGRMEIEGSFDLSAGAAVNTLTNPDGSTKTVRGEFMSCVKNGGNGSYTVTVKLASAVSGSPIFQAVELLNADAALVGATLATALGARVSGVSTDANGNITITILTTDATGAAVNTTGAITVVFNATICTQRTAAPL